MSSSPTAPFRFAGRVVVSVKAFKLSFISTTDGSALAMTEPAPKSMVKQRSKLKSFLDLILIRISIYLLKYYIYFIYVDLKINKSQLIFFIRNVDIPLPN